MKIHIYFLSEITSVSTVASFINALAFTAFAKTSACYVFSWKMPQTHWKQFPYFQAAETIARLK